MNLKNLKNLTREALTRWVTTALDQPAFRGQQLFEWIWRRRVNDFAEMTNLAKPLRERLASLAVIPSATPARLTPASDGTVKLLVGLHDGVNVETVWTPDWGRNARKATGQPSRVTICLSTQYGCAFGCRFCYTGTMGLGRDLEAWEIVEQVLVAEAASPPVMRRPASAPNPPGGAEAADEDDEPVQETLEPGQRRITTNLVFMGMGEPLANLDATISAIKILADPKGLAFPKRRITVSTVGVLTGMRRLIEETGVRLAVSLHATTDKVRDELMPVNRRWPLATLLQEVRSLPMGRREHVTFEYILLAGVNDSAADARRLTSMTHGLKVKVNLIPYNPHPGAAYARPTAQQVSRFQELLRNSGVTTYIRRPRGDDVLAACGQLAGDGPVRP